MMVYHATPSKNVDSILSQGLLLRCARSGARRVWFHSFAGRSWSVSHVSKRHGVERDEVVVMKVHVPDHWLTRFSEVVFWCNRDVPPAHIESVTWPKRAYRGPVA